MIKIMSLMMRLSLTWDASDCKTKLNVSAAVAEGQDLSPSPLKSQASAVLTVTSSQSELDEAAQLAALGLAGNIAAGLADTGLASGADSAAAETLPLLCILL